ncbi:MAG: primosomal protein N' [Alphaproteobacteria bacterium]
MPERRASSKDTSLTDRVRVLLPLPLAGAYDYRAHPEIPVRPGSFVRVPLGRREMVGVVWDRFGDKKLAGREPVKAERLKDIIVRLDAPPLSPLQRRFVDWVAAYTLTPPGAILRMVMGVPAALAPAKPVTAFARNPEWRAPDGFRMTPARERVLRALADGPPRPMAELVREAGAGPRVVRGLEKAGAVLAVQLPPPAPFAPSDWKRPGPRLSPTQAEAAAALGAAVANACSRREAGVQGDGEGAKDGFGVMLLDGVTGSGKTEVYFEAIAKALELGRQVLVLLPEIALSAQWLTRFKSRFGAAPAEWHSALGPRRRRITWRAVAEGGVQVVVGARSALFLPFPGLGLIVVDEEHDTSFKQDEGVLYNARDMAVVRAQLTGIPVVLVSATPSLETVTNVREGRYAHLHLPGRHGAARMPEIHLIDMRVDAPARGSWLSPTLRSALRETFAAREQAMLFLNRRGYAPLTLCRTCGHRLQCPNCSAWLVEHRRAGRLACHHCGHSTGLPETCPSCGDAGSWAACGPGVERLAEEVTGLFPDLRQAIMASDTLTGAHAAQELVRRVEAHEIDLLIGTQVMAKGHHFPLLTLVGVVDADLGLAGGDLRAAERTYQLLAQLAGRAGRAERPGRAYLQTFDPGHPVMWALASGAQDDFLAAETKARRSANMPPFSRLAAVILSGRKEAEVDRAARQLSRAAPRGGEIEVLGPAPAPLARLRGRHRRRFLVISAKRFNLQGALKSWLRAVGTPKSVRVQVDIDPYSFM